MKRLITFIALFFCASTFAQDTQINALVTFTNTAGTTDGMQAVVNGNTRTFKNTVVTPATEIAVSGTIGGSATNYFNHAVNFPYPGVDSVQMIDHLGAAVTNAVKLIGRKNQAMAVTVTTALGTVTFVTNTVSTMYTVRVPGASESSAQRTNIYSLLTTAFNDYSTNAIDQNKTVASQLVGLTNTQTISIGIKTFTGANIYSNATQQWVGGTNSSYVGRLTNGYWTNGILHSPTLTNGINRGNAFSSRGPTDGDGSEQFGNTAQARNVEALAVGFSSQVDASRGVGIGADSSVETNSNLSIAIGWFSRIFSNSPNSILLGAGGRLGVTRFVTNGIGIGSNTTIDYNDSVGIGTDSAPTEARQIMLGSSVVNYIYANGRVESSVGYTNATMIGTNVVTAAIHLTRLDNTSLANGNNAAVDIGGTAGSSRTYVKVSGPTAAFNINGIAGGANGRFLIIHNTTSQNMTIANDSGVDPTAANRIYTGTAADVTITNKPGIAEFIYDSAQSRWIFNNQSGSSIAGVSSVGLALPTAVFDISGSPVTGSGTLTATFDNQSANTVFAGPSSGGAATPTFRALVANDIPTVLNNITVTNGYIQGGVNFEAKATSYTVKLDDRGKAFSNEGSTAKVVFTLPGASAGLVYRFYVQDADGIDITATTSDTIRRAGTVSAADGTITSTAIGSVITLTAINATEWFADGITGTWTP